MRIKCIITDRGHSSRCHLRLTKACMSRAPSSIHMRRTPGHDSKPSSPGCTKWKHLCLSISSPFLVPSCLAKFRLLFLREEEKTGRGEKEGEEGEGRWSRDRCRRASPSKRSSGGLTATPPSRKNASAPPSTPTPRYPPFPKRFFPSLFQCSMIPVVGSFPTAL